MFYHMNWLGIPIPPQYVIPVYGRLIFKASGECTGEMGFSTEFSIKPKNINSDDPPITINEVGFPVQPGVLVQ